MDGFFGIGILELFLIAILALIVLGPERLPGVMREGARYIRMLRKMTNEFTSQFSDELQALDELNPRKIFNEMTDPNRPEPGEKPKPQPGKPPAPKTPATAQAKPKTTTTPAKKPVEKATTAEAGVETRQPVANGHEAPNAGSTTTSPDVAPPDEESQTILPPTLQTADASPEGMTVTDVPQSAPVVETVVAGKPTEA
jgi:sec-independent protein translocase protein TatB